MWKREGKWSGCWQWAKPVVARSDSGLYTFLTGLIHYKAVGIKGYINRAKGMSF